MPQRNILSILLVLILVSAAPALAAAEIIITVVAGAGQASKAILEGPGGTRQEAVDDDRDGLLVLSPSAAGEYRLTTVLGDRQASTTVTVPDGGQVDVLFNPRSEDPITVTYAGGTERIVVTARRREEDLQTIPVSIAAFTADAIEERTMKDVSDLADFTPNMEFSTAGVLGGSSSSATVYIRGIGQISTELFSDPGVGIYVDGVYLARAQGAVFDLVDLERVEVLRGPQGTLFGKNTMGGAISLVTRKPHAGFDGEVSLGAGNYGRLEGDLRLNVPLGAKSWGSLALTSRSSDGVTESLFTGEDYFDDNRDAGRFALRFLPGDHVSVDVSADYTRERESAVDVVLLGVDETIPILNFYNTAARAAGLPAYDERWVTGNLRQSYSSEPNFSDGDVSGAAVSVAWTRGDLEVRSITAYRELENDVSNDLDGSPIRFAFRPTFIEQDQLSQEVQVLGVALDDRLDWVFGGIYFDESSHETAHGELLGGLFEALEAAPGPIYAPPGLPSFLCDPGPPPPGLPCFGGAGNPFNLIFATDPEGLNLSDLTTTSWAVFAEGNWAAGDRLTLTAGVRYTRDEKDYLLVDVPTTLNPAGLRLFNQGQWDAVTPRLAVGFQVRPNLFLYGSISKGFKSGGFNGLRGGGTSTLLQTYDPEELWAWEAGLKTDLAGRRLRFNAAFFWNDYTDLQLTASLIDASGMAATVIENAGEAEVWGFELEMQARPTDSFDVTLGVGHTEAKYTSINEGVLAITLDDTIPKTPEWSAVLSPTYVYRIEGGTLTLRADYSYKSKYYNDVANNEAAAQEGFGLLHARASYLLPSGRWELSLWGKNLTDKEYVEHALVPEAFGPSVAVSGRPREWGAAIRYRF